MIKFLLVLTMVSAIAVSGCVQLTRKEAEDAKKTGGAVIGLFGLPPIIGETVVAAVLALTGAVAHKNGRRIERKCTRPHAKPTPHVHESDPA